MRPVWYHTLIPGCALLALPSCGPGGDCGSGMFCPPPVTGYAQVNGRALRSDVTLGSNNVLTQNPLVVRFAPAHAEVVPTVVELREAAPWP